MAVAEKLPPQPVENCPFVNVPPQADIEPAKDEPGKFGGVERNVTMLLSMVSAVVKLVTKKPWFTVERVVTTDAVAPVRDKVLLVSEWLERRNVLSGGKSAGSSSSDNRCWRKCEAG